MQIRRCAVLLMEPRETLGLDLSSMFSGGSALSASLRWVGLAPHLDRELDLTDEQVAALGRIGQTVWQPRAVLEQQHGAELVAGLLQSGLLVADAPAGEPPLPAPLAHVRQRDDTLRAQHWRPLSAVAHMFSRWRGMQSESGMQFPTFDELVKVYGPPPPPVVARGAADAAIALPAPPADTLDAVLLRRYTGRNFDTTAQVPLALAARLLQRTFGAQDQRMMAPDAYVLKKTSPSAGGLHPCAAYVLAQRIDGIAPGLYHYHPVDHQLEPVLALTAEQAHRLAQVAVADQQWFADAPFMVIVAARVVRNFWKYRNHAKAHRALMLDAGHLSQTFYLLATEAGMGGFVTAAINEVELEQALGLDPLADLVVAVCGCGPAGAGDYVELRSGA